MYLFAVSSVGFLCLVLFLIPLVVAMGSEGLGSCMCAEEVC